MTYVKINDNLYPAIINGKMADKDWDNRKTKTITLELEYPTVNNLFIDGVQWSIVYQEEVPIYQTDENNNFIFDENNNFIQIGTKIQETQYDNSEYTLAGDIIDHRDGTITVKMGKLTELEEAYELILGGI